MRADLRMGHAGVGGGARVRETRELAFAGGLDAGADVGGGLGGLLGAELVDRERGRFDVQVDAIQERAADAGAVALDLRGGATALVLRVAQVAAGARVHRGDEHEAARERDLAGAAGDGDVAVLERLAKHLEGAAFELGQFVEEEHAVVGEGDFAGAGDGAAAKQADVGNRVVRRTHGTAAEDVGAVAREGLSGGGVDAQNLERFIERG